jgi:repressor LexA
MDTLTKRQRTVFGWIQRFIRDNGLPPTVREIGDAFGISPAGAHGHLRALERKGRLRRGKLGARSLELSGAMPVSGTNALRIPIVGRIAAGVPLLAVENIEGYVTIGRDMLRSSTGELFALCVTGDSMIDAGILDGDHVVCRKQAFARDGQIVVALLDDEATLKRFFHQGHGYRLQPENKKMKPIYVDDVTIQGVVKGLVRSVN